MYASCSHIRCLRLPYPVDLITANLDTMNHLLTEFDLRLTFRRIWENLRPGAHFIFDLITPASDASAQDVAGLRDIFAGIQGKKFCRSLS
jgi:hypothetical protein